jgi:hypothetical protein
MIFEWKKLKKYVFFQLKKFDVDESWVPYKLDVEVEMPDEIEMGSLKARGGLQDGEEAMPEDPTTAAGQAQQVLFISRPGTDLDMLDLVKLTYVYSVLGSSHFLLNAPK